MLTLPELDALLQRGGVLLLPNQHGARLWQHDLGRWRVAQSGLPVVAAARIHAIDLWIGDLWQQLTLQCAHPSLTLRLLDAAEETLLWQRVLEQSPAAAELLNPTGTARQLREAQRLLQFWQVSLADVRRHLGTEADDDLMLAWRWLQQFKALCEQQHCLPQSALLPTLLQVLQSGEASVAGLLPAQMLWLDFDDPPPLYQQLQATLQRLGVQVTLTHAPAATPAISVHRCADTAAECRAAAQWAQQIIESDPAARVGIVCPNLQSLRPRLLRIFQQHLAPEQLFCSAAEVLADHPFAATALQLLTLQAPLVDSLPLCRLLRSPWLRGHDSEADARAALEWRLRRRGELAIRPAELRDWALQADHASHSPLLGAGLLQIQQLLRHRKARPLSQWLVDFQAAWQTLLDFSVLTDPALQALTGAWERWLDACRRHAASAGTMSLEQAQAALLTFARQQRLASGNPAAPIHIIAPVETAGLRFTHVQVLQMQAGTWPSEQHPNPCLPWRLQHARQMPAVDPGRELARAHQQISRLQQNTAVALRFSYPAQVDDLPVLPNPLLAPWPQADAAATPAPADLHPAVALFAGTALQLVPETSHLPLPAQQLQQAPGAMLEQQALCPFRAFARYRLNAQALPALGYGLSAAAVGDLVHGVLKVFWQQLRDSTLLHTLAADDIEQRLRQAIDDQLRHFAHKYPQTLTPRLRELEQRRMLALLQAWLEHDQRRSPFTVVETEQDRHWQHGNLQLNLRIDRIDASASGQVVVDYKTGALRTPRWQEPRSRQPQLLLYQQAVQQDTPVAGLLYARVTLEKMGYQGITAQPEGIAECQFDAQRQLNVESWEALQAHWQHCLQSLAQEYLDGLATVAPQFRHSYEHCHLASLCRVGDAAPEPEGEAP